MGLPEEQFESIEMYMPRKSFTLIQGGLSEFEKNATPNNQETAETDASEQTEAPAVPEDRYRNLHRYVNKAAEAFWLIDTDEEFGVADRLTTMARATLHLIPEGAELHELDTELRHVINQAHIPASDLAETARQNGRIRVPDFRSKRDRDGNLKRLGEYTYHDVHDMSAVRFAALNALRDDDFAAIEVVRSLEGWRWANDVDLSHDQHEVGRLAFEAYLFSIGSIKFLPALGHAATAYLK